MPRFPRRAYDSSGRVSSGGGPPEARCPRESPPLRDCRSWILVNSSQMPISIIERKLISKSCLVLWHWLFSGGLRLRGLGCGEGRWLKASVRRGITCQINYFRCRDRLWFGWKRFRGRFGWSLLLLLSSDSGTNVVSLPKGLPRYRKVARTFPTLLFFQTSSPVSGIKLVGIDASTWRLLVELS